MKLILLDSNSLAYRAHYAMSATGKVLANREGVPTGAVHGFFTMLLKLIADEKPTHIAAAFDVHAPTFRHSVYAPYKGTRKPMPEELVVQMPIIKELLGLMNVPVLEMEGFEADDILGTLARRFDKPTVIVTGDKDSFQLIDDTTTVFFTRQGMSNIDKYTPEFLLEKEGLTPRQFLDYKALRGDVSDNIPGIAGIGEKTAKVLLDKYGTLEAVLSAKDELNGALAEKIGGGREAALLSKQLATIVTDVPIFADEKSLRFQMNFSEELFSRLAELELTAVSKKLQTMQRESSPFDDECGIVAEPPVVFSVATEDIDSLEKVAAVLSGAEKVGLYLSDKVSFSVDGATEYVIAVADDLFGIDYSDALKSVLDGARGKTLCVYDVKSLLSRLDVGSVENSFDLMLAAHLDSGSRPMKGAADCLASYGYSENACGVFLLSEKLRTGLSDKGMSALYSDTEFPLIRVLAQMEKSGFTVSRAVLSELSAKYSDELSSLTETIYSYAGGAFNVNSGKQLGEILFEKLGLRHGKKNKTGTYSVDVGVLEKLADESPIIAPILRYRTIFKLKSTYADGLQTLIKGDGKIHTVFNQCVTATGRLSSTEPNLQNIPTRTAEGREIRRAFSASKGRILISADYSQIELRLLAHFSGDGELIRAYTENADIHALTASQIYNIPIELVTPEMRSSAKAVNFGIIYGISAFGLAENTSLPRYVAKEFIERYFQTYPAVKKYMDGCVSFAVEHGYVTSWLGRRRSVPELMSSNHNVRSFGERVAMNMPLQGTAADVVKRAMLGVSKRLSNMKSDLILQVHDELIVDAVQDEADEVEEILRTEMENAGKFAVPLSVNVGRGEDWYSAK